MKSMRMRHSRARRGVRNAHRIWPDILERRDRLDELGVDGRIILKRILKKYGVGWFNLVQDRDEWWALVNTVMNFRISQKTGTFSSS
jgi:hypothetical protein